MVETGANCFVQFGYGLEDQLEMFGTNEVTNPRVLAQIDRHLVEANIKSRQIKLHAIASHRVEKYVDAYLAESPEKSAVDAVRALIVRDRKGLGRNASIEDLSYARMGQSHAVMYAFMDRFRTKKLGFAQDKQGLRNFVRALFGERSGDDQADAMAKAYGDESERLRMKHNKMGGKIGKLENWAIQQSHSAARISAVPMEEWVQNIIPLLDRNKMLDELGKPIDDTDLLLALKGVYMTLASDGLSKLKPGKIPRGISGKMANRHSLSRFLHFKDGESWLKYHDQFGEKDIYSSVIQHMDTMNHEIAMMSVLGPDPDRVMARLQDVIKIKEQKPTGIAGKVRAGVDSANQVQHIYDQQAGKTYGHNTLARTMSGLRGIQTSIDLGAAAVSALSDLGFIFSTAKFNGIPLWKPYARLLSKLGPRRAIDREFAARMGLTADFAIDAMSAANRFSEVQGYNWGTRAADTVLRATGLNALTNASRVTIQLEFLSALTDSAAHSWKGLSNGRHLKFKRAMERYGITEAEWNAVRAAPRIKQGDADFIDLTQLAETNEDVALKIAAMINAEKNMAVPTPGSEVAARLNQGTSSGTLPGEAFRTVMQYKSFPVTILMGHLSRGLSEKGFVSKLDYLSTMFIAMTLMGAVSHQAKEVIKGRKPRTDYDTPEFWMAAALQGGGLGLFGDFLFADQTRYGGGLLETIAGPSVSRAASAAQFVGGDFQEMLGLYGDNKPKTWEQVLQEATQKGIRNVPGSRAWFARLAFERAVSDNLNQMADPKWHKRQRRMRKREREAGLNDYWWKPGRVAPNF